MKRGLRRKCLAFMVRDVPQAALLTMRVSYHTAKQVLILRSIA
jgi:hypothetical protein